MIGYKRFYKEASGSMTPILVVGVEGENFVIWKLIYGIVLERVVSPERVYSGDWGIK